MTAAAETIAHHLRLFGFPKAGLGATANPRVAEVTSQDDWGAARRIAEGGVPVVMLCTERTVGPFEEVEVSASDPEPTASFSLWGMSGRPTQRLRSLHPYFQLDVASGVFVLVDAHGAAAWAWLPVGKSGLLLIGTDLYRDLVRYRQGDPATAADRPQEALWGIAGERPVYLYEAQLAGEAPGERFADWWCMALRDALAKHAGIVPRAILPGGGKGAIVITGDDDQAPLADYGRQRALLGDLPITYFLHPLTKQDAASLGRQSAGCQVDWALHPDALEAPQDYAKLFVDQARWFKELTGTPARAVRNHGFLNDGYWGHLPCWLENGVAISANLPGLDGRVLNGSLLPARMTWKGKLTDHWSILTAIGDGVVFVHGDNEATAAGRIRKLADDIVASGVPGVIVLNLHPANVARTGSMHAILHELAAEGFLAWNLRQCLEWFDARDRGEAAVDDRSVAPLAAERHKTKTSPAQRLWARLTGTHAEAVGKP